uniref:Uncharacterized protein n=1 Tax=Rhizophora mucronata TaxID=61149 RepID=A0A2P2MYF4_RHIMU
MKFDEVEPPPARTGSGPMKKTQLTSQDLSFVGYTYKNFDAIKALCHSFAIHSNVADLETGRLSTGIPSNLVHAHSDSSVDYSTKGSTTDDSDTQGLTSSGGAQT